MEKELEVKVNECWQIQAEELQEFRYLGSKKLIRGLKLWEFDVSTGKIKQAEMQEEIAIGLDGQKKKKLSVIHNPNAIYHQAHNYKAAYKKFRRIYESIGGIMIYD